MKTMLTMLALALMAGCDSEVTPVGGGNEGGNGPEGGSGGDGNSGGNGGSGVGGAGECQAYIDQEGPPVQTVPISVRNSTDSPIYLGLPNASCAGEPLYRAETDAGVPVKTDLLACERTCSDLAQGGCECLADCAQPSVIMIHPGGMADLSWTAVVYEPEAMPEECYADPSCAAASCVSPAAAGPLVFFVDGYSELADCSQAICDCDGGESGACIVEGATLVSGTPVAASSPWSPSEGSIGITFQ